MTFYCGIDLGATNSHICVVDQHGEVVLRRKLRNDTDTIIRELRNVGPDVRAVVESTFNWYWLVDALREHGFDITLAHACGVRAITAAKVKTDPRDALALARLLRLGAVPQAFIYPPEQRAIRDLFRRRIRLVRARGNEFGAIRRLLMRHGQLDHSRNSIIHVTQEDLATLLLEPDVLFAAVQHLERAHFYDKQVVELERRVLTYTHDHLAHDLKLLESVPGISTILGLTILYEAGPMDRFRNARHFSSYARVVPGTHQSGSINWRRGYQSKQGNANLKWAFTQAALYAVRYYARERRYFEKHLTAHAGRAGRLISYNTVAHKLAVAVFHILRDRVPYDPARLFGERVVETGEQPHCTHGTIPSQ